MRTSSFAAASILVIVLAACGGGGGGGNSPEAPTPHVSYTVDGTTVSMEEGLAEAGGVPHAEVYAGPTIALFAATTPCAMSQPPQLATVLFIEGGSTGTFAGHLFQQDGGSSTPAESVSVTVTRLGPDGGQVEGSFSGSSISGGFVARRDDAVDFFAH